MTGYFTRLLASATQAATLRVRPASSSFAPPRLDLSGEAWPAPSLDMGPSAAASGWSAEDDDGAQAVASAPFEPRAPMTVDRVSVTPPAYSMPFEAPLLDGRVDTSHFSREAPPFERSVVPELSEAERRPVLTTAAVTEPGKAPQRAAPMPIPSPNLATGRLERTPMKSPSRLLPYVEMREASTLPWATDAEAERPGAPTSARHRLEMTARGPAPSTPSEVHVTIGRIEVSALERSAPAKRPAERRKAMSLDAYLARRKQGGP